MTSETYDALTHFDSTGQAHMVNVVAKTDTHRIALAAGTIRMLPATLAMVQSGTAKKGDVLGIARMGAKRTSDLIPLCDRMAITRGTVDSRSMRRPAACTAARR